MKEHKFRGDLKLGEDGEVYRYVNLNGEPVWICISKNPDALSEILIRLLREVVER